jgi:hypothetical protein
VDSKASVAFALGGLGGFNAHGAGFLDAATHCEVIPDLVTATSGQIVILAQWLMGRDLRKASINPELEHNRLAQLAVAVGGEPGVFQPAYLQAFKRWFRLPDLEHPFRSLFDRLYPAEVYVPTRKPEAFAEFADAFNNKAKIRGQRIGVVFNAYNLRTGQAVLFGNDRARDLWEDKKAIPTAASAVATAASHTGHHIHEPELTLHPITPEAVEASGFRSTVSIISHCHISWMAPITAPASSPNCICSSTFLWHALLHKAGATSLPATGSRFRIGRPRCGFPPDIRRK